jgi:hypothetical protein
MGFSPMFHQGVGQGAGDSPFPDFCNIDQDPSLSGNAYRRNLTYTGSCNGAEKITTKTKNRFNGFEH